MKKLLFVVAAWLVAVTGLHLWINFEWVSSLTDTRPEAERKLDVAYIPVT